MQMLRPCLRTNVSIDRSTAREAARLKANNNALRPPDALALASARQHGVVLLTLDESLRRVASEPQD